MRISSVDAIPYALPLREPYVTARGRLERRELVLVRVRTDEGIEGLGEGVALALRGGPGVHSLEREIHKLAAPKLVGMDLDSDPLPRVASAAARISRPAAAAVDLARLDLAAKLAGIPLWRLLGAESAQLIACNATLGAGLPRAVADDAQRWASRGFSTLKLKVGVPGDVAQVKAVRDAVGYEAKIRVDANGVWPPEQARERLAAMERFRLELAEQPSGDLEDLRLVRQETAIPIAADESLTSAQDAQRAIQLGACDLATVKLAKVGGIGPARSIARRLPVYLSSALDGPVGIAAAAHLAQVLPREGVWAGIAHGLATQLLFADTIASIECELRDGFLHLPGGPGLGVEIDQRALERCRL